jgi:uncharacterized RDD family membrane protein YckC
MNEQNAQDSTLDYPLLSLRIQSTFIDLLVIIILMFLFSSILDQFKQVPDWVPAAMFVGIWVVYEPLCTSLGFTIGNLMRGLRVRQHGNPGQRINFFQALLRYVIKLGLGWISFLTINSNPEKRAIHDFAAGSVMIKA